MAYKKGISYPPKASISEVFSIIQELHITPRYVVDEIWLMVQVLRSCVFLWPNIHLTPLKWYKHRSIGGHNVKANTCEFNWVSSLCIIIIMEIDKNVNHPHQ